MKEVLKPYGSLDCLYYYSVVAKKLRKFLKAKEIATRTWLPKANIPYFIRRASEDGELFVNDIKVSDDLLKIRAEGGLEDFKDKLSEKEKRLWRYFVPRKIVELHYSVNGEKADLPLERIYFDIDRKEKTAEEARRVALNLIKQIKTDETFNKLVKYKIKILWTGKSFHVILLLRKKQKPYFYDKNLSGEKSFTAKWANEIEKNTGINVEAQHEREKGEIIIDSSQSPSGKLARAPFSLHVDKKTKKIDGVAVPLSEKQLSDKNLIKKLNRLTPDKVLKNLSSYKI